VVGAVHLVFVVAVSTDAIGQRLSFLRAKKEALKILDKRKEHAIKKHTRKTIAQNNSKSIHC
jgi:hypothetical protein